MGCWCGYLYGVRCRFAYGSADATATDFLLLLKNSDWLWYRLTQVIPDKVQRAVKGMCVCVCVSVCVHLVRLVNIHRDHSTAEKLPTAVEVDQSWQLPVSQARVNQCHLQMIQ